MIAVGEEVRCVGDVLAAVAAVDEATARQAAAMIAVEYEVLEPVTDPLRALDAAAVRAQGLQIEQPSLDDVFLRVTDEALGQKETA